MLQDIEEKQLPLSVASVKFDVPYETLRCWYWTFRKSGKAGLLRKGGIRNMKKKRQLLEEKQRSCERIDLSDLIELGKNIIILAKKIDEYDAEEKTE